MLGAEPPLTCQIAIWRSILNSVARTGDRFICVNAPHDSAPIANAFPCASRVTIARVRATSDIGGAESTGRNWCTGVTSRSVSQLDVRRSGPFGGGRLRARSSAEGGVDCDLSAGTSRPRVGRSLGRSLRQGTMGAQIRPVRLRYPSVSEATGPGVSPGRAPPAVAGEPPWLASSETAEAASPTRGHGVTAK